MGNKKQANKLPEPRGDKRAVSQATKTRLYLLIANTLLLLFIYFGAMSVNVTVIPAGVLADYPILLGQIVYLVYWAAFGILLIAYLLYNRAFRYKGITAEMLPDSWSREKREEFIADVQMRVERSRWMLWVIIPLLVTVAVDAIYLFTWPMIQNLLNIK
ncbi:MAG: hypothetical protein IJY39_10710 [Clostridia bacterium]|nr:hypothetical protein [Clostridia bacterium]